MLRGRTTIDDLVQTDRLAVEREKREGKSPLIAALLSSFVGVLANRAKNFPYSFRTYTSSRSATKKMMMIDGNAGRRVEAAEPPRCSLNLLTSIPSPMRKSNKRFGTNHMQQSTGEVGGSIGESLTCRSVPHLSRRSRTDGESDDGPNVQELYTRNKSQF